MPLEDCVMIPAGKKSLLFSEKEETEEAYWLTVLESYLFPRSNQANSDQSGTGIGREGRLKQAH